MSVSEDGGQFLGTYRHVPMPSRSWNWPRHCSSFVYAGYVYRFLSLHTWNILS